MATRWSETLITPTPARLKRRTTSARASPSIRWRRVTGSLEETTRTRVPHQVAVAVHVANVVGLTTRPILLHTERKLPLGAATPRLAATLAAGRFLLLQPDHGSRDEEGMVMKTTHTVTLYGLVNHRRLPREI